MLIKTKYLCAAEVTGSDRSRTRRDRRVASVEEVRDGAKTGSATVCHNYSLNIMSTCQGPLMNNDNASSVFC